MTAGAGSTLPPEAPRGLALGDFDGLVGTAFTIGTGFGEQVLVLGTAREVPGSLRPEGGFRLEFNGVPEIRLPQSVYAFTIGATAHDIFIVPIGPGPDRRERYEAIFF